MNLAILSNRTMDLQITKQGSFESKSAKDGSMEVRRRNKEESREKMGLCLGANTSGTGGKVGTHLEMYLLLIVASEGTFPKPSFPTSHTSSHC